jgi:hypothetical protein
LLASIKVAPIVKPDDLAIEIAVKLPNQYILDLPENIDVQRLARKSIFFPIY